MKLKSLLEAGDTTSSSEWFAAIVVQLYNHVVQQSVPETVQGYTQIGKMQGFTKAMMQSNNLEDLLAAVYSTPDLKKEFVYQALTQWAENKKKEGFV